KNLVNLPMHTARIPSVDPAPATITAALDVCRAHNVPPLNCTRQRGSMVPQSCDFVRLCNTRRTLRHESFELLFKPLNYTNSPALGNGLRRGIGKYVLLSILQAIEDAARCGFGRGFGYLEAAIHVGVDGSEDDRMYGNAVCRQ